MLMKRKSYGRRSPARVLGLVYGVPSWQERVGKSGTDCRHQTCTGHVSCCYYSPSRYTYHAQNVWRPVCIVKVSDRRDYYGCNGKNPGLVLRILQFSLGVLLQTVMRCWTSLNLNLLGLNFLHLWNERVSHMIPLNSLLRVSGGKQEDWEGVRKKKKREMEKKNKGK